MAVTMPLFWMKSIWRWKIEAVSWSKPTMKPALHLQTGALHALDVLDQVAALDSASCCTRPGSISSGVSMPTNTAVKPAFAISCINSSSSARLIETSVLKVTPILSRRHSMRAGSSSVLRLALVADQVVVDEEDVAAPAQRDRGCPARR